MNRLPLTFAACCLILVAACSGDDAATISAPLTSAATTAQPPDADATTIPASPATSIAATPPPGSTSPAGPTSDPGAGASVPSPAPPGDCDPDAVRSCLLPWPNDAHTIPDEGTSTGLRLAIPAAWAPANADGTRIDVTDQNRADGFSPGSAILIDAPGVDLDASGVPPSTDIGASVADGAPIVIADVSTGERWPYWGELDAASSNGAEPLLVLRPAESLAEGHTYSVTIGTLVDSAGDPVPLTTTEWSFTVASAQSLSGRLLHMRDDAYASLDGAPPTFTVTSSTSSDGARTIDGTIDVPLYLSGRGEPGSSFVLDDDGLPTRNPDTPSYPAPFRCVVPTTATEPAMTLVYGHGLLSSRAEVGALSLAAEIGLAGACASDWIGMSSADIAFLAASLGDLSTFGTLVDRLQQGLLNAQFLGRAINDERAFAAHSAFRVENSPVIAPGQTQYIGNSLGGVLGGAASAISTEWDRAVLGVPGMNFSLLLPRSSFWNQLESIFAASYTTPLDRVLALQLMQLLWDRGENSGYAQHVTSDPFAGIREKDVLLIEAFGDHQVANVSTEVLARTMDVPVYEPSLAPGRSDDVDPQWGLDPLEGSSGSALYVWDFGTPAPPPDNVPPTEPAYGRDPHAAGIREQAVLTLALAFLESGSLPDVCGGEPCVSDVLRD